MPGYDLHTHTVFSDGTTTPAENVRRALAAGLQGLGVTDHDTVAAWEPARAAAAGTGLEIVPGTELSAEYRGFGVHLLGYWFDPAHHALAAEMDRLANERHRRAEEIVARFNQLGIPITLARVRELAGAAPIGRPHLAAAVVETGAAEEHDEVFNRWLHDGGPAYVPKYALDPEICVRLIRQAGGVAVLAHPGLYGSTDDGIDAGLIEAMSAAGLDGIEAEHPDHTPEQRARYSNLARSLGLVVTAGSDFHGARKDLELGQLTTSGSRLEALRERLPAPP